jgi:micrococcal nuclease
MVYNENMNARHIRAPGIALLAVISFLLLRAADAAPMPHIVSATVVAVHDGDTLSVVIGHKKERVRLIGIDAPELGQRPWGANAKRYLRELVTLSRSSVGLEFDLEKRDKYGRLLAYVWTRDNKLINLEMVRNGYAVLYTFPPNVKRVELLREGQRYARENGLGIWGRGGLKEMPRTYRREHPR